MTVADRHLDVDQLSDALDGCADPAAGEHLESCPDCRAQLADWQAALERLEPPPPASPLEVDRIVRRALASAAPRHRRRPPHGVMVAMGVAAALAACVLAGVGLAHLHVPASSKSSSSEASGAAPRVAAVPTTVAGRGVSGGTPGAGIGTTGGASAGAAIVAATPANLVRLGRAAGAGHDPAVRATSAQAQQNSCRSAAGALASAAGYGGHPVAELPALLAGRAVSVWVYADAGRRLAVVTTDPGCDRVVERRV